MKIKRGKRKNHKKIIVIIVFALIIAGILGAALNYLFVEKSFSKVKDALSDLNPFKPSQEETETPAPIANVSEKNKSTGGTTPTTETTSSASAAGYGTGMLNIINSIDYSYYGGGIFSIIHYGNNSENYVNKEDILYENVVYAFWC